MQGGPAGAIQIANPTQIVESSLVPNATTAHLQTDSSISMNIQSVDSSVGHQGVLQEHTATGAVPVVLHAASEVSQPESFTIIENPDAGQCSVYDDDGGLGGSTLMGTDITGDGSEQILTVAMAPGLYSYLGHN